MKHYTMVVGPWLPFLVLHQEGQALEMGLRLYTDICDFILKGWGMTENKTKEIFIILGGEKIHVVQSGPP